MTMTHWCAAALTLLMIAACNPEEKALKGGNTEQKPTVEGGNLQVKTGAEDEVKDVASATYDIKVQTASGATPCLGSVDLVIQSNFAMRFPNARLNCGSMAIDLGKILAATGNKTQDSKMSSDGKMMFIEKLGSVEFAPARPFLIGPIIQNLDDYQGFNTQGSYQVSYNDNGGRKSQTGSIAVRVLETKTSYSSPRLDEKLDNIIHWEMTATGYKNVPVADTLLFDKMEFYWNVRPIMVPKIVIQGDLGGLISDSSSVGGGKVDLGALIGKVTITLSANKFTWVDGQ